MPTCYYQTISAMLLKKSWSSIREKTASIGRYWFYHSEFRYGQDIPDWKFAESPMTLNVITRSEAQKDTGSCWTTWIRILTELISKRREAYICRPGRV